MKLLDEAKAMRGSQSSFEQFYEGAHYFFHDQPDKAAPLLETAAVYLPYRYDSTKLLAIIQLDRNQPAEAARLMNPYLQIKLEECDQAYIVASLDLLDGRKAEAKAILNQSRPQIFRRFGGPALKNCGLKFKIESYDPEMPFFHPAFAPGKRHGGGCFRFASDSFSHHTAVLQFRLRAA